MRDYANRVGGIKSMAKANGWDFIDHQKNIYMLSFERILSTGSFLDRLRNNMQIDRQRINIYYSKMTVATSLNHPKKGKTQLYRKNVAPSELIKIFKNPRQHTGKGYYKKTL